MNEVKLAKKRSRKHLIRKKKIQRRLKCHGTTDACKSHEMIIKRPVFEPALVEIKKSWWQKLKEFLWRSWN